jgi:hypothetical protein
MMSKCLSLVVAVIFLFGNQIAYAEIEKPADSQNEVAKNEVDAAEAGPQVGEVETVSANGSITRAKCPHSCSDRKIPKASCREWRSKMYPDVCYVEDLSKPSNAVPVGK